MKQKYLFHKTALIISALFFTSLSLLHANHGDIMTIEKTEKEWRETLTKEEFHVLREDGTEPSHSSPLNKELRDGTFVCAACGLDLFKSKTKFDSGTGWPSFYEPIAGHVETKKDWKLLFLRTEYHCARCGGHQGHIFDDGPDPTGKRYCNNGVALKFVSAPKSNQEH